MILFYSLQKICQKPYITLIGIFLFSIVLRYHSFTNQALSDDEAIYSTMAETVLAGGKIYSDVVDHKPPGIVYLYEGAKAMAKFLGVPPKQHLLIVHIMGMVFICISLWGLYHAALHLLPATYAFWPPLLYAVSSASKSHFDGLAVNGELLMNAPIILAIVLFLKGLKHPAISTLKKSKAYHYHLMDKLTSRRLHYFFAATLLAAFAALIKWQALVVIFAWPFWLKHHDQRSTWFQSFFSLFMIYLAAFSCVWGGLLLLFYCQGNLTDFWQWGILFNIQYIQEGPTGLWALQRCFCQFLLVVLPSAVLYGAAIITLWRPLPFKEKFIAQGYLLWLISSLLAVVLGWRFFGHYFLQLELPLALLAAPLVHETFQRFPYRLCFAWLSPAIALWLLAFFPQTYEKYIDHQDANWQGIAQALETITEPNEKIFIWGNTPMIYYYTQRSIGGRFIFCNYLTRLSPGTRSEYDPSTKPQPAPAFLWQMLIDDLDNRGTEWILDTSSAGWKGYGKFPLMSYPIVSSYFLKHYEAIDFMGGSTLYHRKNIEDPAL